PPRARPRAGRRPRGARGPADRHHDARRPGGRGRELVDLALEGDAPAHVGRAPGEEGRRMSEQPTPASSGTRRPSVVVLDYGFGNVRSAVRALERVGADVELTADRARAQDADGLVVPGVGAFAAVMAGLRGVRGDEIVGRRLAGGRPELGICVGMQVMFEQGDEHGTLTDGRGAGGPVWRGGGALAAVMAGLRGVRGEGIGGRRLAGGRPVLGICVGMQVMFEQGDEHGTLTDGLGEWAGLVDRLEADVVPHMGWDTVDVPEGSVLFRGVEDERFYFVHSYAARTFTTGQDLPADSPVRRPLVTWSEHGGRFVAAVENGPLSATQFHPEKSGDAGATLLENWVRSL